jgi:hypothetical protein
MVSGTINGDLVGNVYELYDGIEDWFVEYEEKEVNSGQ